MLEIIYPAIQYKTTFLKGLSDMEDYYPGILSVQEIKDMGVEAFIEHCHTLKNRKLNSDKVPSSEMWLMDNDTFIGAVSIRHELNDFLKEFGGHVGYAIRPSERKKGYGKKALALALTYLKKRGINEVFVTCDEDNIASQKIIQSSGGVLQDIVEIPQNPGKKTMRWWIKNA